MFQLTTATRKVAKLQKRIRGVAGGTGASKTISILLLLIDAYQSQPNRVGSIVSESVPHLKRGAMRDFFTILKVHGYYNERRHNKTDSIYTFESGSFIEFFPADDSAKLRGGRRDDLFVNEANNISLEAFNELEIRTRHNIYLDWNPVSSFWFYEDILPNSQFDVDHITLTYKDNEALEPQVIKSIEARRLTNPNWYKVYGLGQIGKLEGLILHNWETIKQIPQSAELVRRGLDFGYTNDPTVLVDIYKWNNSFIVDEVLYATGMSNRQIADVIRGLSSFEDTLVVADSAEPKSIDEIKSYGVPIVGSIKGPGSVNQRIQLTADQQLYLTENSVNIIKDFRNWQWKVDRSGRSLNVPEHEWSHSGDAVGYAIGDYMGGYELGVDDFML